VFASYKQGRGEGVPERVKSEALAREPGPFEEGLVLPIVEVVVVRGPADSRTSTSKLNSRRAVI
jgi:hypothetical protein